MQECTAQEYFWKLETIMSLFQRKKLDMLTGSGWEQTKGQPDIQANIITTACAGHVDLKFQILGNNYL